LCNKVGEKNEHTNYATIRSFREDKHPPLMITNVTSVEEIPMPRALQTSPAQEVNMCL
jgi:hypothetical protein